MKKFYFKSVFVCCFLLVLGCSKDILKSYDTRIIGSWRIADVNKFGLGGDIDNLPFREGSFRFNENGTLTYTNLGAIYQGTWDIQKKVVNDETFRSLYITVVDFVNQQVLSQYYDDVNFSGTDHLKGRIIQGYHTFVTHFRR